MPIPFNVIANADDFGLNTSVNEAILFCFRQKYINSTSLLTNTSGFDEAVQMIREEACINNIGVHVNLAEGVPLTTVCTELLTPNGNWDIQQMKKSIFFPKAKQINLKEEIFAQVDKALSNVVTVNHIDSHYHLHTLPGLHQLFMDAAKYFNLKLRLAQTYREGSYLKYGYRLYMNNKINNKKINYSNRFETVDYFLKHNRSSGPDLVTEVMLHPSFDSDGKLTDHYDDTTMLNWIKYIKQPDNQ